MGLSGSKLPDKEGFLVEQTPLGSGFLLGRIASTHKGPVTLRFHCDPLDHEDVVTSCDVVDTNEKLLFSVHLAKAKPKKGNKLASPFDWQPLRKASIVRDPAGVIIGMLATDRERPPGFGWRFTKPASYTGYAVRPRFAGQVSAVTVEGVPMYAWFMFFAPGGGQYLMAQHARPQTTHTTMIYLYGSAGLGQSHAYDYKLECKDHQHGREPPWKFTVRKPQGDFRFKGAVPGIPPTFAQVMRSTFGAEKARAPADGKETGVAYGDTVIDSAQGTRNEVTIARGMDAGLVAMAAFCPALLDIEHPRLHAGNSDSSGGDNGDFGGGGDCGGGDDGGGGGD